jgi:hypothetical protein
VIKKQKWFLKLLKKPPPIINVENKQITIKSEDWKGLV